MQFQNLSIIVPVYNEEATLLNVLKKLSFLKDKCNLEIIIINDGSIDNSKQIIESNSKLYKIIQKNEIQVNSIHHQAINKIGNDLQITAKSSDGVIEGVEVTNGWNAIGVQWHPENMLEDNVSIKLFEWLNS